MSPTELRYSVIMRPRGIQKKSLSPPLLTMATGNLVNLEKTPEIFLINVKFLASCSKKIFLIILAENLKKAVFQLSTEGAILLVSVNSSQIFSEGLLVIVINKVQRFSYNQSYLMLI